MNRYESRTCTFVAPSDWVAEPPYAFRERGEEGDRLGVQILERCLADMPTAASYARDQKLILAELYEGFELLQEEPQRLEGPGEGYAISFRYIDEDENPSRGKMIFLTCGPMVCQFLLSGPDGDDLERDRLFESIGKTFAFRGAESLAGAKAGGLTSEVLRMPQAEAAKGWPGPWRKFPRCCVELPLPTGWEVTVDEADDVVFRRGGAEIRLHRELGENNEADTWFADRMRRLQERGDRLLGSEQGENERGDYAAVLYEEGGTVRTWKTAAVMRGLDLFMGDQQALLWTFKAPETEFSNQRSLFDSLIAASVFLPQENWETRLIESWIDFTLRGPWQAEGAGVYANTQGVPEFILLSMEPTTFLLEKLQPSILESMRQGLQLKSDFSESTVAGIWRQHDAFHYAVDGVDHDSQTQVSVRAVWLAGDRRLYSIFVRGNDSGTTEAMSRKILSAFRPISPSRSKIK